MVFQWYLLGYFPNGLRSFCYFLLTDPGMSCHCRMQFSAAWNYQQALQAVNEVRLTCPNRAFLKSHLGGKSCPWPCSPICLLSGTMYLSITLHNVGGSWSYIHRWGLHKAETSPSHKGWNWVQTIEIGKLPGEIIMDLCLHAESQGTDSCPFNLTSPGTESREPVWCPAFTGNTKVRISCLCLYTHMYLSVCLSIYPCTHTRMLCKVL